MTTVPAKPAAPYMHCPGCRRSRRCRYLATITLAGKRRSIVQCCIADCSLTFVPVRDPQPQSPSRAAARTGPTTRARAERINPHA